MTHWILINGQQRRPVWVGSLPRQSSFPSVNPTVESTKMEDMKLQITDYSLL